MSISTSNFAFLLGGAADYVQTARIAISRNPRSEPRQSERPSGWRPKEPNRPKGLRKWPIKGRVSTLAAAAHASAGERRLRLQISTSPEGAWPHTSKRPGLPLAATLKRAAAEQKTPTASESPSLIGRRPKCAQALASTLSCAPKRYPLQGEDAAKRRPGNATPPIGLRGWPARSLIDSAKPWVICKRGSANSGSKFRVAKRESGRRRPNAQDCS